MSERIATDRGISKHEKEIWFFNDLLIDLKLQVLGKEPRLPITMERLMEGSEHCKSLHDCRKQTTFHR